MTKRVVRITQEGKTEAVHLRFRMRDVFPPTDPVSVPLLRLMSVVNDALLLGRLLVQFDQWKQEGGPLDRPMLGCEGDYLFRMLCAHLYEAGSIFRDLERVATDQLGRIEAASDEQAKAALSNIRRIFGDHDFYEDVLGGIRHHVAFHYDPRGFRWAVNGGISVGEVILTDIQGFARYTVADMVTDEMALRATGEDKGQHVKHVLEALTLSESLGTLVKSLLGERLKACSEIVETRGLLQLPPAAIRKKRKLDAERARESQ